MRQLEGRRALVTGGGTGIGKGITRRLAEAGALVTIAGRREDVLEDAARDLNERIPGANVHWTRCDVRVSAEVEAAVAAASDGGRLDIAVANAGGVGKAAGPFLHLDEDAWRSICDLNIVGTANTMRCAAWRMREHGGCIVAISTTASVAPQTSNAHYSATKAAVNYMVMNAAWELGRFNIRVNSLLPGFTPLDTTSAEQQTANQRDLIARTALGRAATPEDHGDLVVFLAGPGGSYITGQLIAVDGGMGVQPMSDITSVTRRLYGNAIHDDAYGTTPD